LGLNPHLADFCDVARPAKQVTKPYSLSIEAGKNTYVYDAHTYHTKVPPQGIAPLIEYYTVPGAVVLDPFCGSGMTGVAATETGRAAILTDLSPAAAFIAYNHATPAPTSHFMEAVQRLLDEAASLERFLYETSIRGTNARIPMLYMVWSFGLLCSHCSKEFVLWDVARDERESVRESKILSEFDCPHCGAHLGKRSLKRTRRYPVQVGYRNPQGGTKEATATPDADDFRRLEEIERDGLPAGLWYPTDPFVEGVNTKQPMAAGIARVDQCYTKRALWAYAHLWRRASEWPDAEMRHKLLFVLTSLYKRITVFSEFRFWGGSGNTANFNVPAVMNEQNVFRAFERKAKTIALYFADAPARKRQVRVSCQSACSLPQLPDKSVDYVFTDPPFGSNINYSEMNLLWEAWLGIRTDTADEAIVNRYQSKGIDEYQAILGRAFREANRVLKDGGWMTVVFHNSSAEVWSALQGAIIDGGFTVRGAQTFDKKHGTFKQFVSDNAVGYDLVLHCQKANEQADIPAQAADVDHAKAFISSQMTKASDRYTVRYLHVKRASEFDYRRLYADWLQEAIQTMEIRLSFAEFRKLADAMGVTSSVDEAPAPRSSRRRGRPPSSLV
jgi:16S rRNA G966 N2-methylase RsmD/DNA-directed RNA polymerase subunit RPC12/RpoP